MRLQLQSFDPVCDRWMPLTAFMTGREVGLFLPTYNLVTGALYRLIEDGPQPQERQFLAVGPHEAYIWHNGAGYANLDLARGDIPYPLPTD